MNKFFKWVLPVVLVSGIYIFASCTGCKSDKQQGPQPTAFEQSLQAKDTADVEQLIGTFFSNLQEKKFYEAAAMIYTRTDTASSIEPLSNAEMDKFAKTYKQIPCEGYKIDYIKFLSQRQNEVACSMILQKGQNGEEDAVTKLFFITVLHDGKWCLILTDSKHFEEPFTKFEQRDSLSERYQNYKKAKK